MTIMQPNRKPRAGFSQDQFCNGSKTRRVSLCLLAACLLQFARLATADDSVPTEKQAAGDVARHAKAIAGYDQVLKLDPGQAETWQRRGEEHFKLGHIQEAISDFDRFLELKPEQSSYHWQRGLALYYAGRFADGRKQFELHQTVNPNDVENAAWLFLCVAREAGAEKARAALLPIKGDGRVPMMEVHALFAGKAKPDDVLKAAGGEGLPASQLNRQLFYAHLYLGLYFEVMGDKAKSLEHLRQAAGQYQTNDYMGDVARVHLQLRDSTSVRAGDKKN